MARPTKFSQSTADRILTALKAGNTRVASALYAGIDYSTLKRWAASNAPFCAALDRSEAEAEVMYAATVAKSAREGDWRAAMAWLERRRHDDWRERKELQHTGKDGERLGALSDDDIDAQIAAFLGRSPSPPRATSGTPTETLSD